MKPSIHTVVNEKHESVLAVLVLYEKEVENTESLNTILNLLRDRLNSRLNLCHILIYDNSENNHEFKLNGTASDITYFHNPHNGGTVAAYSYASELAERITANWLLLLDQDTTIPSNYLVLAANELNNTQEPNVAALVPCVKHADTIISPAFLNKYGSVIPTGYINKEKNTDIVTAISSGVFINTKAFKEIMPFPNELWLDYVDHWIFLQFSRSKWSILSFSAIINHHLSIKAPSELNARRVISILNGELVLLSSMGSIAKKIHHLRIAYRAFKYLRLNPKLVPPILGWLARRIIYQNK